MMQIESIKWIHLEETDSTNRWAKDHQLNIDKQLVVVSTDFQTAGKGCGKNHWESERGKNLTYSILTRPQQVKAQEQYIILMAGSLAIYDSLSETTTGFSIKWPNDIYWHDKKISGTLSECSLHEGMVKHCILGTGLNVNQHFFTSDAPNPVSLYQIIGKETSRLDLIHTILQHFLEYISKIDQHEYADIQRNYLNALYRKTGFYEYKDCHGNFMAETVEVEQDGHLILRDSDSKLRRYAFKEVQFVIDKRTCNQQQSSINI